MEQVSYKKIVGEFWWPNGDHYKGEFKEGLIDGKGIMPYQE